MSIKLIKEKEEIFPINIKLKSVIVKRDYSLNGTLEVFFSDYNISVIYGENGCGKTTILRLINAFLSQNDSVFSQEKVKEMSIRFLSDGMEKEVVVSKKERKELITDIKATGSAITDTDKGIVNSFSNGLLTSDNGYVDSLPKSTITKTKNKQSYTWEMTYSEYKKYYDDYRKEVEKQRKKLLNTSAYKRASDIEKTEMLKQLSKDVLKDTKEKYKNRNALKFKKDE